jgi:hypothetical protein
MGGDAGERLLPAGESAGVESCFVFHMGVRV